jgi:hypothetical protein
MVLQGRLNIVRKYRDAVLLPLAVSNNDLVQLKIDIFYPKSNALNSPQTAAI